MQTMKARRLVQPLLLAALFLITASHASAQATPDATGADPAASPAQQTASPAPSPSPVSSPKVVSVDGDLELDDIVVVNIENLEAWSEKNEPSKLVPYIDGRAIKGNYPEELHLERGRVIFHLEITPENKKVWTDLLGAPSAIRRPVALSVGLETGSAFDSVHHEGNPVPLTVISPVYGFLALVVIAVTLILLIWLATRTNIIREP